MLILSQMSQILLISVDDFTSILVIEFLKSYCILSFSAFINQVKDCVLGYLTFIDESWKFCRTCSIMVLPVAYLEFDSIYNFYWDYIFCWFFIIMMQSSGIPNIVLIVGVSRVALYSSC